jgi:hypothetical protein
MRIQAMTCLKSLPFSVTTATAQAKPIRLSKPSRTFVSLPCRAVPVRAGLITAACCLSLLLCGPSPTRGGDWPQVLGPHRNGIAEPDEQLARHWPREGPPEAWSRPVGSGQAGVAIAGQRVFLFHRVRNHEILEALDLETGKTIFQDSSPTTFHPRFGTENGPLCVPTVSQGRVITFGAQGLLTCLNALTGQRIWQRDTQRDFRADGGDYGAGSCPLVIDQHVIVNIGGRNGAGIVGFDLNTGATLWKSTSEPASDSAPVPVNIEDQQLAIMLTRYKCLMLDPKSGTTLFEFPFGRRGPSRIAASPLILQDRLFVTASDGVGAVYTEFDLFGTRPLWTGERPIAAQSCTPIHRDGFLYVINGRDDVPPADLLCVELASLHSPLRMDEAPPVRATGNATAVKWVEHDFGPGRLLMADRMILAQKTDGELLMFSPTPERYQRLARCRALKGPVKALPALSNGFYILRNDEMLKCLRIGRGL